MATILAANTGNWSATSTWTGGVVPVAGDIVVANGKTITMDTLNVTVAELRNDTTAGAVAGGSFNLVNGSNVTANIYAGSTGYCVGWGGTVGQTATITGAFFGGNGTSTHAISCSSGNLTVGGGSSATGGTGTGTGVGISFQSSGTFIFATAGNPGAITGGTSSNQSARGMEISTSLSTVFIYATTIAASTGAAQAINFGGPSQTVNIIAGNIGTSTSTTSAIICAGSSANHTYTVSGNITAGVSGSSHGISITTTGTYNIIIAGNINGNGNSSIGVANGSTATVNITGNIINNATTSIGGNYSVNNASTGTVNITGTVTAGNAQHTVQNASTGIVRCTRAKGNGFGVGSTGISNVQAVFSNNQGSLAYIEELEFGSLGNTPVTGPIRLTALSTNKAIVTTTTGSFKTLVDTAATSGILPAVTDVRSGVVYSSGNLTGTCAVPGAGSVAFGVPVDNTVGTAILTAANLRTALGLASANLDAQIDAIPTANENAGAIRTELTTELTRVNNCATVATTGQQIQDALI